VSRVARYDRALTACGVERPEVRAVVAALVMRQHRQTEPLLLPPATASPVTRFEPPRDYAALVGHVRSVVAGLVEPDETVLVVSRGDPALLELAPARAGHFPQGADGGFAGYYPHDAETAVAHLQALRDDGAAYLVFPATSAWWLDHYGALASYLLIHARVAHHDPDCLVFDLRTERSSTPS